MRAQTIAAALYGRSIRAAALIRLGQEEVAGVIGGVGFHQQQVPVAALTQVTGHIHQALVVEFQQLDFRDRTHDQAAPINYAPAKEPS